MNNYDKFSRFYDAVMGDRRLTVERVEQLIKNYHPNTKTILEVACGTGALLAPLAKTYSVSGLDLSAGMLEVAKGNIPHAHFYKQDMVNFSLEEKFDTILCLFDSINHLLTFDDWGRFIERAWMHLCDEGMLIFDINTEKKMKRIITDEPFVRTLDDCTVAMHVDDEGGGVVAWKVDISERSKDGGTDVYEESIREIAFPTHDIVRLAASRFASVEVIDFDEHHPRKSGERLYMVCKK